MEFRWTSAALLLCLGASCISPGPARTHSTLRLATSAETTATALAFTCRELFPGTDPELSPASVSLWTDGKSFRVHYARDAYGRVRMDRNIRAVLHDQNAIEDAKFETTEPTRAVGDTVLTVKIERRADGGSDVEIDAEDPERRLSLRLRELAVALDGLHELERRLAEDRGLQAVYLARALADRADRRSEDPVQNAVALLAAEAELSHGDPARAGRWIHDVLRSGRAGHRAHTLRRRCAEIGAFTETIERDRWRRALEAPNPTARWTARAGLTRRRALPEEHVTDHLASNDRTAALAWMRRWRGKSGRDTPAGARLEDLERVAGDRRAALAAGLDRAGDCAVHGSELAAWVSDAVSCGDFEGALRLIARHGNWELDPLPLRELVDQLLPHLEPRAVLSVVAAEESVELYEQLRHRDGFDDPRLWRLLHRRLRRGASLHLAAPMAETRRPALQIAPR